MDLNRHKFLMLQILKDIYSDAMLASVLGFKGGTALMFFYQLPRFSVDLDFNLLDVSKQEEVFNRVRNILLKYGKIHDEAIKFYGPLLVLDYGAGELTGAATKTFVRSKMLPETIQMMQLFQAFPLTA